MAIREVMKLNDSDIKVMIFLGDQMRRQDTITLESSGLAESAIERGVVNAVSSFSTCLARLKHYRLVESVRSGRGSLYTFTQEGEQELEIILKDASTIIENKRGVEPDMGAATGTSVNKGTIAEQLQQGMEQGKLPNIYEKSSGSTYVPPAGVALPKAGDYSKDVKGLCDLYRDRLNGKAEQNELERIEEWHRKLTAAGQPAYEWIQAAICITSTKVKTDQRHIAYAIGILKSWSKWGYGSDYNQEQRKMFEKFEERFGYELSPSARQKLIALVDTHGIVETLSTLFLTQFSVVDMSKLIVDQMEQRLSGADLEEETA